MKRCPTCDKTFEDSMRFCQVDGTPLIDDVPFDPYATMVARPQDLIPADDPPAAGDAATTEEPPEPIAMQAEEAPPIAEPEDVLDLPEADPLKTMYVSDAEMQAALSRDEHAGEGEIVEIPPIGESPASDPISDQPFVPEQPSFSVPDAPAPSSGDVSPPPSPYSTPEPMTEETTPASSFNEAETMYQSPPIAFEPPAPAPVAEWTPPPAPDASWQNREIGANTPFQAPPAGAGLNQTLPIVSLILGIISICCYVSPVTGIAALITGYLGMKNANSDPEHFGGKGLAIAGMILGGVFFLVGAAYYIIWILIYAGVLAGSMLQGF
ncbi:MAG: DUF4190 domain-containing protein [Pyrinomonadaceae bacterium]